MSAENRSSTFKVVRAKDNLTVVPNCGIAKTPWSRIRGLLGKSELAPGHGLMIDPCNQVHTFFMQFPIEVIFLSSKNEILKMSHLPPWRISSLVWKARRVLEIPSGTIANQKLGVGDQLEVVSCSK
jgi:uncharacterized membrane protein (UPF0127 family)